MLPSSTPLVSLLLDVAEKTIASRIRSRILFYWHRLWSSPVLGAYRSSLQDLLAPSHVLKIPWLVEMKKVSLTLGLESMWYDPTTLREISRQGLKDLFWRWVNTERTVIPMGSYQEILLILNLGSDLNLFF